MNHQEWNRFVLEHGPASGQFLHSWEWGEFQKVVGEHVRREVITHKDKTIGLAQWLDRTLPLFGTYSFCPKGPLFSQITDLFQWKRLFQNQLFLRVEPEKQVLMSQAYKSIDLNPAHTLLTDLSKREDELMQAMHPKTRYNIRVAQKHGVQIHTHTTDFEMAWNIFEQTSARGQFRLHAKNYYRQIVQSLQTGECQAFLAFATHQNLLLAANIMIDFGSTRTYLHGASSNEYRNLMGPYLLHWELIKEAKQKGMETNDWWGVAPLEAVEDHPWAGISRFKRGFGGIEFQSPGTYDVIGKPFRYHLYQLARRFRRMI